MCGPAGAGAVAGGAHERERRRAVGQGGRRRAEEHFAWESIVETTLEVYRSVLPSEVS